MYDDGFASEGWDMVWGQLKAELMGDYVEVAVDRHLHRAEKRREAMKCRLFFVIAFPLLVAAWGTGCSGGPTSIAPRDEPIGVQAQSDETSVVRETADEKTGMPTVEPQGGDVTVSPTPTPEATGVEPPAGAEQVVQLARADLAQKLGLTPEAIRLVSVEAVEWSDASLGCPKLGMMYAQVITPGFRVVLEAKGKTYEYHTDPGRHVVLCGGDGLDVCPMMLVAPHGRVCPTPRMPDD